MIFPRLADCRADIMTRPQLHGLAVYLDENEGRLPPDYVDIVLCLSPEDRKLGMSLLIAAQVGDENLRYIADVARKVAG